MTEEEVTEVMKLFRLAGTFIAKSIVDDKLIDLPISNLMWDLLLGKVSQLAYHTLRLSSLCIICVEIEPL